MNGEWNSGNIFIRPNPLKMGEPIVGDVHNFDHTTVLFTGEMDAIVTAPDGSIRQQHMVAPAHLLIKADHTHTFIATVPGTVMWCIYSHRNGQGEIVQEYDGWMPGYV